MSTFALLSTILEKSPVETSKLFNELVMERVADLIDERRKIIAEDLASEDPDEEEDFVDDADEDDYDLVDDDDDFEDVDFDDDEVEESFQGPRGLAPMKPKVKLSDGESSKKPRNNYDRTKRTVKEDSDYAGHKARVRRLEEPVAGGEEWDQVKYPISSPADKFDENKPVKAHWYIGQNAKHTRHPNLAAFKAHHAKKNGNHVVGVWNA
jgi:hypothetical protein